jgi:Na+/melibiose symporter-like transporter
LKEAVKSSRFWFLCVLLFDGIFFGIYFASVYKVADQAVLKDKTLTIAGALGSVCNGCSRIMWASLQDKFGFKKVYLVLMLIQLISACVIWKIRDNAGLYIFFACLVFACEGGHFSMYPTACAQIFNIQQAG